MTIPGKLIRAFLALGVCTAVFSGVCQAEGPRHATAAKARALSDAEIIGAAEAANSGEVEEALLAEKKARWQTARSFAGLMVTDHEEQRRKLDSVAKDLDLSAQ